ncbi:hypothetical protein BN2475_690077 [Paraburkholderia ribeironis]|uniref:Uncharacterized protein n=1 Tax=Paraburkholderia ribeironis TaxID=1247936 RepID=A0A1N7SHJ8_9BURK|nr:hypothetical protein BN2475_690077 [Paraburkholderia ribeironis]
MRLTPRQPLSSNYFQKVEHSKNRSTTVMASN